MNELALFAGAGGGLLGTQQLGFKTLCAVELDLHRRCLLAQRQNERLLRDSFPIWDDIRTFDGRAWRGRVDMVSGGFPCQAFSTAARGRNTADDLWGEMRRVVADVSPRYVFAENVSTEAIEVAGNELSSMGFKAEMLPLSASDLGADHMRKRYWLLAYTDDKSQLRSQINAKVAECKGVCESFWRCEPDKSGMADGISTRMERYEAIGNGQVPVVAAAALWTLANA